MHYNDDNNNNNNKMMGHQGMTQPMAHHGPVQGMYGPQCSPAGFVTLDPSCYPGAVTLDPGNPCCVPPMMPHQHQHHHHTHHCKPQCPEPAPKPEPCPKTYVVKKGDTVYLIAKRFGTSMQAIILANNLQNPDLIYPGQVLYIPNVPDMRGMRG